jgi:hypothetical protein
VKALGELNATEATFRLNALIDAASAPAVDSDTAVGKGHGEPANPAIKLPDIAAIDAWQTLYRTLPSTIGAEVNNRSDEMICRTWQHCGYILGPAI